MKKYFLKYAVEISDTYKIKGEFAVKKLYLKIKGEKMENLSQYEFESTQQNANNKKI